MAAPYFGKEGGHAINGESASFEAEGMIVLSIQRKAEAILGLILQVAAVTITAALIVAGVQHPEAVSYVFMAIWGQR